MGCMVIGEVAREGYGPWVHRRAERADILRGRDEAEGIDPGSGSARVYVAERDIVVHS